MVLTIFTSVVVWKYLDSGGKCKCGGEVEEDVERPPSPKKVGTQALIYTIFPYCLLAIASRKHAYIILTPLNPTLYSKTGVYRDIHYFSYFCSKT